MDEQNRKKLARQQAEAFVNRYANLIVLIVAFLGFTLLYMYYNGYKEEVSVVIGLLALAFIGVCGYYFFKIMLSPISRFMD